MIPENFLTPRCLGTAILGLQLQLDSKEREWRIRKPKRTRIGGVGEEAELVVTISPRGAAGEVQSTKDVA